MKAKPRLARQRVYLSLTLGEADLVDELRATGLYGVSVEDVILRMLDEGLQRYLKRGSLADDDPEDDGD